MNWNLLYMYVKSKQMDYFQDEKIPRQERVIDELDRVDIAVDGTIRRIRI
jgi:hypothetical protein